MDKHLHFRQPSSRPSGLCLAMLACSFVVVVGCGTHSKVATTDSQHVGHPPSAGAQKNHRTTSGSKQIGSHQPHSSGHTNQGSSSKKNGSSSPTATQSPTKLASSNGSSQSTSSTPGGPTQNHAPQKVAMPNGTPVTVADLATPAIAQLHALQDAYIAQANALYSEAVAAHRQQRVNALSLYNTYFQKGIALENSSQDSVNQILFHLKDELQAKNLPTDVVSQLRNQYNAQASEEMKAMASHVVSALHGHS